MKFRFKKSFQLIVISLVIGMGIIFALNFPPKQTMSENEVRTQLEQMYDAEVAGVTMKQDRYNAVIKKSGSVYLVEINADTGDIYSLKHTNKKEFSNLNTENLVAVKKETPSGKEKKVTEKVENNKATVEKVIKPISKIGTTEKAKPILTPKENKITPKESTSETPEPANSNAEQVKDEKPIKKVMKVIKEAIKTDTTKSDKEKVDASMVEEPKPEVAIIEGIVEDSTKAKSETIKKEERKETEEQSQMQGFQALTVPPEQQDTQSKPKTETVLITEEQAIKTAQKEYEGVVESSSFVKTDEGGYYLIVMKASTKESDSKEISKAKTTKATIQVHAISRKILSVTLE